MYTCGCGGFVIMKKTKEESKKHLDLNKQKSIWIHLSGKETKKKQKRRMNAEQLYLKCNCNFS